MLSGNVFSKKMKSERQSAQYQLGPTRSSFLISTNCSLQWMRQKRHQQTKGRAEAHDNCREAFIPDALPFELTDGQKKVVNEICFDLRAPYGMNRFCKGT